jgi:hypothetical protein
MGQAVTRTFSHSSNTIFLLIFYHFSHFFTALQAYPRKTEKCGGNAGTMPA